MDGTAARRLRDLLEPLAAGSYFGPETLAAYRRLHLDEREGYFCARAAPLGDVSPLVVAAAFGVFRPSTVARHLRSGWSKTTRGEVMRLRETAAQRQLERLLGPAPATVTQVADDLRRAAEQADLAGRPLFAALLSAEWPRTAWARLWRAADLLREHRGGAHISAWSTYLDAVEVNVMTALWLERDVDEQLAVRGWTPADVDAAQVRLAARSLIADGRLTKRGVALREEIERETDRAERAALEALLSSPQVLSQLQLWSRSILRSREYPAHRRRPAHT